MKFTNALFLISIGLLVIMFSPNYGSNGLANGPMLVIGLIIVIAGSVFLVSSIRKNRKNKKSGGE